MKWLLFAAVAVFPLPLVSQSPGSSPSPTAQDPAKKPAPPQNRIDQRAQAMREQIDQGKQVQANVRVAVRLKNGNKLTGVVKDGKMVERVDGLRFVEASAQDKGAGIRIYYTGGTRNYVFVPFTDFAEYEVLGQLSNKQLAQIEQEMQMEERRAAERAAAGKVTVGDAPAAPTGEAALPQDPKPAAETPAGDQGAKPVAAAKPGADPKAGAEPKPKSEQDQQREWFALLQDFPASGGWGKARRDEIARRQVVVGAKPSENELRFVKVYDEWVKACAHFGVNPEKKAEGTDEPAENDKKSRRKK